VLVIHNPDHFAIGSGPLDVVAAAVVGDFQDLVQYVLLPRLVARQL
jgi:hypothetical protein